MACERDYSKGLIYTIKTNDGLYVGSTCDFNIRKSKHKSKIFNENCNQYNLKLYKNIRENGGEWNMEILHLFPCENKRELEKEEDRVMLELNANLNGQRAHITEEERKNNKNIYSKLYNEKNKDKISEYKKLFNEKNKDKISEQRKLYCEKNRAEINAKQKLYYQKNKQKILQQQQEKYRAKKSY